MLQPFNHSAEFYTRQVHNMSAILTLSLAVRAEEHALNTQNMSCVWEEHVLHACSNILFMDSSTA